MGNHHSNGSHTNGGSKSVVHDVGKQGAVSMERSVHQNGSGGTQSRRNSSKNSLSRTTSGSDINEKAASQSQLLPVEKLAKILTHKSQQEEGIHGVGLATFTRYLFPRYPILAEKLYHYYLSNTNGKHNYLTTAAFKQQCDKLFADCMRVGRLKHLFAFRIAVNLRFQSAHFSNANMFQPLISVQREYCV